MRARVVTVFVATGCGGLSQNDGGDGARATPECAVSPSPQLTRLTHAQYDNAVRDLLGIEGAASEFLPDPAFSGFDNNAEALEVSDRLARDYQRAAEELAERVVTEPALLDALRPCEPSEACFETLTREL